MKKLILTSILAFLVAAGTNIKAQDFPDEYLGLPGDNLNLYAVMKLFQESETLEGFERSLNDENSRINNLDLNGDNLIDYIMVSDYVDGDVHNIVLRTALNKNDFQDVAVFTVQKFRDGSVQIQLIGDEALYGKNYIIEPIYEETPNPGYMGRPGNNVNVTVVRTTPYEIAVWPLIRFIFLPDYIMWRSSWYWGYYPSYWHPWNPFYWHYYYGYHYNWYHDYYGHYHRYDHYRYPRYNDFYYSGVRAHSPQVNTRINKGQYKSTYSHPEQRRDGEALYTKMNPDQNNRRPANTTGNTQERRTEPRQGQERTNAGTRPVTTQQPENTVNNKPDANRSVDQKADVVRRPTTSATSSPERKPSSGQNAGTSRKSSEKVSGKSANRPESVQRSEKARTSRQSEINTRSTGTRGSKESKARTTERKSDKPKESDKNRSTHRR
jgi:hypothetical protein